MWRLRIQDQGYRLNRSGFWVLGLAFWVEDPGQGYRLNRSGFWVLGLAFWVEDLGSRLQT